MNRLLARSALSVDSSRRSCHREARSEPGTARDVQTLLARLRDATKDDVLYLVRRNACTLDYLFEHQSTEDDRVEVLELSISTTDGSPDCVDDDNFTHVHRVILGARISPSL